MKKYLSWGLFLPVFLFSHTAYSDESCSQLHLLTAGDGGYHTYRIPALVVTNAGTLLVFCEGRKDGRGDFVDIDILLKRSLDNGRSWEPLQVLWDSGKDSMGNSCPVVDRNTGVIYLLLDNKTTSRIYMLKSDDDGITWTEPKDITNNVMPSPEITKARPSPGHAIQLENGRLLFPAVARGRFHSFSILSDDHGATWKAGSLIGEGTNECMAVELVDGSVYMSCRHHQLIPGKQEKLAADISFAPRPWSQKEIDAIQWTDKELELMQKTGRIYRRARAISNDKGQTWSETSLVPELIDPRCQASIVRFTDEKKYDKTRILFANPASTDREDFTVRISYDECKTWNEGKALHKGPAAYSDMAILPDMTIGCVYENGDSSRYERITFARFNLEWLTDGRDTLTREKKALFVSGTEGYDTYRIPSLIVTKNGTLLAFCEGRKKNRSDAGDIDLLVKRSMDGGRTWTPQMTLWDDGDNTCGNPCPVVDRDTGTIWLLMTWNLGTDREDEIVSGTSKDTRRVFITSSNDDGKTWKKPKEITDAVKRKEWTWYATGPGVGIQLQYGDRRDRLIVPCDHKASVNGEIRYHSHVIFSDDHGKTWQLGGIAQNGTNESQIVERIDGSLLLNMRRAIVVSEPYRFYSISKDGGMTWSDSQIDTTLIGPRCQASIIRFSDSIRHDRNRLLFSNPASKTDRSKMTVRLSYDEGIIWPVKKVLHEGPSAYSCLAALPDMTIGCLYENGDSFRYERITFSRFNLAWLTDGTETLSHVENNSK